MLTYPPKEFLTFTTLPKTISYDFPPLIGTVINESKKPVVEALITLQIPGMEKLATVTKVAGNFLLPLTEIYPASSSEVIPTFNPDLKATLTIFDDKQQSQIAINPFSAALISSPLILGQDQNLTSPTKAPFVPHFDINNDGKVNSLDRSIILKNFGSKPTQKVADLNQDGVVNNQDLQLGPAWLKLLFPP